MHIVGKNHLAIGARGVFSQSTVLGSVKGHIGNATNLSVSYLLSESISYGARSSALPHVIAPFVFSPAHLAESLNSHTSSVMVRCAACRASGDLQKCSGCEEVMYCGRPCQKAHWPTHKHMCKAIVALSQASLRLAHSDWDDGHRFADVADLLDEISQRIDLDHLRHTEDLPGEQAYEQIHNGSTYPERPASAALNPPRPARGTFRRLSEHMMEGSLVSLVEMLMLYTFPATPQE